jgi:hypothetical protein
LQHYIFTPTQHLLSGTGARGAKSRPTGTIMANNVNIPKPDRADNRATYERFMGITKWSIIVIVIALLLMAILLV